MVAIGGAIGSVARYLIGISPLKSLFGEFPFPTFLVNIVGSFLIGFLLVLFTERLSIHESVRLMILSVSSEHLQRFLHLNSNFGI